MKVKIIAVNALIAAAYVVLTLVNPIGFSVFQFRISEVIALLPFYEKKFIPGCILGVFIANAFSPLGILDVMFGVGIVLIAYFILNLIKNIYLRLTLYSILCGIGVGAELLIVASAPFLLSFFSITASMLVISFLSIPIDRFLIKALNKFSNS